MLDESHQKDLIKRLNRVEGQVRGIKRMIQEPRLCLEILHQLGAAEAAMRRVSAEVFKYHVGHCVPESVKKGGVKQVQDLAELVEIFDQFSG